MIRIMNSITPEMLNAYLLGGLLVVIFLGRMVYIEIARKKCHWCHKEFNRFDETAVKEYNRMFCSDQCYLQYKERRADVEHKEKIAGKGNVNTNINEYRMRSNYE